MSRVSFTYDRYHGSFGRAARRAYEKDCMAFAKIKKNTRELAGFRRY
ncbi:hypothetical protein ACFQ3C_05095 [Seohaeicola saemankumensis]|uniref:Uncharacterized protein n=1 Tax=Seohaeicola saemankumensis TaxID=481181 RepID=A0ABW3TDC5_9RHOB